MAEFTPPVEVAVMVTALNADPVAPSRRSLPSRLPPGLVPAASWATPSCARWELPWDSRAATATTDAAYKVAMATISTVAWRMDPTSRPYAHGNANGIAAASQIVSTLTTGLGFWYGCAILAPK